MSAISFDKFPPNKPPLIVVGSIVKDAFNGAFGQVVAAIVEGAETPVRGFEVRWLSGLTTAEHEDTLIASSATEYFSSLSEYAHTINVTPAMIKVFQQGLSAQNVDPFSFDGMVRLDQWLLSQSIDLSAEQRVLPETIQEAIKDVTAAQFEGAIFAFDPASGPDMTVDVDMADIFGGIEDPLPVAESDAPAAPVEAPQAVAPNKVCALCENVGTNKSSPTLADGRRICKKCDLEKKAEHATANQVAEPAEVFSKPISVIVTDPLYLSLRTLSDFELDGIKNQVLHMLGLSVEIFFGLFDNAMDYLSAQILKGIEIKHGDQVAVAKTVALWEIVKTHGSGIELVFNTDPKFVLVQERPVTSGTAVASKDTSVVESTTVVDAQTAKELTTATVTDATTASPTEMRTVRTEAGVVDPETGELVDESFIKRKFGWTELPVLAADATYEQIAAFERRLDEVVDRASSHKERAARYRSNCEARCAPLDKAAAFYEREFIVPMARMLAPHKLKTNKHGEYTSKTLVLESGSISFKKGGGAAVSDRDQLAAHIEKVGLESFKDIKAERKVSWDSAKLLAALNKGVLKDLPGTTVLPVDHFATTTLVLSSAKSQGDSE